MINLLYIIIMFLQSPIALIDPTQLSDTHANLMKQVLEIERVNYTHYPNGIVLDMQTIAQFREASIVVIPRSLTVYGCDNPAEMGAVLNALKDLSRVAVIYTSAFECPEFDPYIIRVSTVDNFGNRPGYLPQLPRESDLQIEGCYFGLCQDSYAIIKAGIR